MGISRYDPPARDRAPWNFGAKVGPKRPFTQKQILGDPVTINYNLSRHAPDSSLANRPLRCTPMSKNRMWDSQSRLRGSTSCACNLACSFFPCFFLCPFCSAQGLTLLPRKITHRHTWMQAQPRLLQRPGHCSGPILPPGLTGRCRAKATPSQLAGTWMLSSTSIRRRCAV